MKFIVDKYKIIFKGEKYQMHSNYTHKVIGSKLAFSIPQGNCVQFSKCQPGAE